MSPKLQPSTPKVSVIGIGNILLGDDGFGPLAVEMFRCEYQCGSNVEILDLGTPGSDIAPYMYDKDLVLLVDAVQSQEQPGTLCIYREADIFSQQMQLRLTAHDPGVQEALMQLRLAGHAPFELLVIGVVPASCGLGEGISPVVLSSCSVAVETMAGLLADRAVACTRIPTPLQPDLWWFSGRRHEFVV